MPLLQPRIQSRFNCQTYSKLFQKTKRCSRCPFPSKKAHITTPHFYLWNMWQVFFLFPLAFNTLPYPLETLGQHQLQFISPSAMIDLLQTKACSRLRLVDLFQIWKQCSTRLPKLRLMASSQKKKLLPSAFQHRRVTKSLLVFFLSSSLFCLEALHNVPIAPALLNRQRLRSTSNLVAFVRSHLAVLLTILFLMTMKTQGKINFCLLHPMRL